MQTGSTSPELIICCSQSGFFFGLLGWAHLPSVFVLKELPFILVPAFCEYLVSLHCLLLKNHFASERIKRPKLEQELLMLRSVCKNLPHREVPKCNSVHYHHLDSTTHVWASLDERRSKYRITECSQLERICKDHGVLGWGNYHILQQHRTLAPKAMSAVVTGEGSKF